MHRKIRGGPSGPKAGLVIDIEQDVGALANGPNTVTLDVPGALPGDAVIVNPSPTMSDILFIAQTHAATTADAVSLVLFNNGAPTSPGPLPWVVTLFR
jgi:hypothetical protein